MKSYIRGVGSGLPIVREYLDFSRGSITIEDNLGTGSVVTISMIDQRDAPNRGTFGESRGYENAGPYGGAGSGYADGGRVSEGGWQTGRLHGNAQAAGGTSPRNIPARMPRGQALAPHLSPREQQFLPILLSEGELGVTELSNLTEVPPSSTYVVLQKLEEAGLIAKVGHKRILTDLGYEVAQSL